MDTEREFDELILDYLLGNMPTQDVGKLEQLLMTNPEACKRFAELSHQEVAIRQAVATSGAAAPPGRSSRYKERSSRRRAPGARRQTRAFSDRRSLPRGLWISIAACLAIIVGAHIVNLRQVQRMPDVMMGKLANLQGLVRIERHGEQILVWAGMDLLVGDRVRTGESGGALIDYASEQSFVRLLSNTEAKFRSENGAKRIDIPRGTIECDVAKQPEGKRMVLETPHAKAEVKGTQFRLKVDLGSTDAPGAITGAGSANTRIDVFKGLVRFERLSDGKTIDVPTGRFAIAGEGYALRTYSARTEYVEGKILFEDDFEEGFDHWTIRVRDNRNPVMKSRLLKKGEHTHPPLRVVDEGGRQNTVAVLERYAPGGENRVDLVLKARVPAHSFVMEYDLLFPGSRAGHMSMDSVPGEKRVKVGGNKWVRGRVHIIASKESPTTKRVLTTYYFNGKPTGSQETRELLEYPGLLIGYNSTDQLPTQHVDNVVVRELIRVDSPEIDELTR